MEEVKKFVIEYEYDYTEDVDPQKINNVVKNGFGFGTNIINTIGNKQSAILDYDKLQADGLLENDTYSDRRSFNIEGKSYAKVTEDINKAFGLKTEGVKFNSTLDKSTKSGMENTDDYEYGIRIFLGKAIAVTLKPITNLSQYVQDKALHDIAGFPVNGKVEYPSDNRDKLKKLFSLYGTHIITKAIFGCRYQYIYMRESINQETKLGKQVDCNLTGKFKSDDGLGDLGVNLGQTYDDAYTSCRNSESKKEYTEWIGGGNVDTFENWEAGMDFLKPTTIALIGYVMPGTTDTPGLVPLWEIVSDSARAEKLEEAYNEYLKENVVPIRKSKKVIIDVFGKHFENKENAPDIITEPDYNGKMRKFKRLDEEIMRHVVASKKGSFYFYYAMAYSTSGGLSEIKFGNRKDNYDSPWQKRGDHANEGVTGCLDDNIILIKPANSPNYEDMDELAKDEYEKNLISGFGVDVEGSKRISENTTIEMNWITGGCDWYKGLSHDKIHCIYTKDKLKE